LVSLSQTAPGGVPFGKDMLYRNWKKACKEIGIDDNDTFDTVELHFILTRIF